MSKEILSNEWLTVVIDEEIPVMIHHWLVSPSEDDFKAQLMEVQKLYLKEKGNYQNLKWLADTKLLGERSFEEEKCLEEVWEKMLFEEAGVKVHAVLLGDDIYADYSMEKFKSLAAKRYEEEGVKLGVFIKEENAMKWLKEN